ncbi:hypothetical protein BDQ12DRAFT_242169 [Crucibulum laeve]|uniref:Uncharacterized protein n=1 Tax=Crucibulum laeve TaxID=68775 RepID=A0A5C3LWK9_9AGAR|nr:hypothetical protein BDQ12DRAFT_242169 [Crucibulum laeve]
MKIRGCCALQSESRGNGSEGEEVRIIVHNIYFSRTHAKVKKQKAQLKKHVEAVTATYRCGREGVRENGIRTVQPISPLPSIDIYLQLIPPLKSEPAIMHGANHICSVSFPGRGRAVKIDQTGRKENTSNPPECGDRIGRVQSGYIAADLRGVGLLVTVHDDEHGMSGIGRSRLSPACRA